MDFLNALSGMFGSQMQAPPQAPQVTAAGALPDNLKAMFVPLMESIITNATRANDPISRLSNVGSALFESSGSGTPFAKNLAALDTQGQQAQHGAANMFLNVLGMDRQVEQLKTEERRHTERMDLDRARFGETVKQHGTTTDLELQRIGLTRDAEARRGREEDARRGKEVRADERKQYDENVKMAMASVPDEQKQALAAKLAEDKDYQNMLAGGMYADAGKRLREHFLKLAPKYPKEVMQTTEGLGTLNTSLNRMRTLLKEGSWADRMVGPETRTRFQTTHAQALNAIRALGEMGVLTPGEIPFAERFLPSPTEWGMRGKESILAGFDELDRFIESKLGRFATRTGMSEEQIRKLAGMGPKTSSAWRGEPPQTDTASPGLPPGAKDTGRKTPDGRPIYLFPDGSERAPPKR